VNRKKIIQDFKTYFILGIKFGIIGSLIGFIIHFLWGNLQEVKYTIFNGFIIGFFVGFFEQIFSITKVARFPYSLILFFRTLTYFILTIVSIYTLILVYLYSNGLSTLYLRDPEKFEQIKNVYFLTNINAIYIIVLTLVVTFIWQLKSFFGKGILINYLIGRYHKPAIESRIFMFLDLNDATTLAEKLGSKKYSSFLSEFFNDLDYAFTITKGQVFQYVGDEIVIKWKMKDGLKNNNCINAFFLAVDILEDKKDYYINKYDTFPSFKASIHLGEVTVTEIGVSKREIVYHGDTINTASRIYSSAHRLKKNFLISKALYDNLNKEVDLVFEDLGENSLKGKDEKIHIYSIESSSTYNKQIKQMY
jgi:adenylate cyclase